MTPDNDHQAGDNTSSVWWRTRWMEAIYDSGLTPTQRFVASVYADFAGIGRTSWASISTVMHRTGYGNKAVVNGRKALIDAGWLVPISKPTRHKAATYALVIPGSVDVSEGHPSADLDVSEGHTRYVLATQVDVSEGHTTNPLEILHQSSLSLTANQRALQKALGCDERDERLMIADSLFEAHNVRSASAWLRAAKENGDLDELISQQQQDAIESTQIDKDWSRRWKPPTDWDAEREKAAATNPNYPEGWGPPERSSQADSRQKWKARVAAATCTEPGCINGLIDKGDKVHRCPHCHPASRRSA